jgi:large subunit ribosomal protein L18
MKTRVTGYFTRHERVRKKISGTAGRPRMAIKIANRYMYVQFIDDDLGHTLASASSLKMDAPNNAATARLLGLAAANVALESGIREAVVDRGGHRYHGRVKAIVEAVAEKGLLPGVKLTADAAPEAAKEEKK